MNRTVKNVIIGFTFLCAVLLVFFSVELFLINRDTGDGGEPGSSIPTDSPNGNDDNGNVSDDPNSSGAQGSETSPGQNGNTNAPESPIQPPSGVRHELPMLSDEMTLVLYAEEGLFDYTEGELSWLFNYKGSGKASLEIVFDFVSPPGGFRSLAEKILAPYLEGREPLIGGEGRIRDSQLQGYYASGVSDGDSYELWIHSLLESGDDGLVVVFIIHYENDIQKNTLYALVDTMEMVTE